MHDIDAAEGLYGALHVGRCLCFLAHIGGHGFGAPACRHDLRLRLLHGPLVAVDRQHRCALGREQQGARTADAAARSGYDRTPPRKYAQFGLPIWNLWAPKCMLQRLFAKAERPEVLNPLAHRPERV